jgi:hypothetical protein
MGGFLGSVVRAVDHVFYLQGGIYILTGILLFLVPAVRKLPKLNDITREGDAEE